MCRIFTPIFAAYVPVCLFGPTLQEEEEEINKKKNEMKSDIAMKASSKFPAYDFLGDSNVMNGCGMDGWMDGWTDGQTDKS